LTLVSRPIYRVVYLVVAYDITDDKRRNRIAKVLEDYGDRVQYSVFECNIARKHFLRMRDRLEKIMNPDEDSIIFYHLCRSCEIEIERMGVEKGRLSEEDYIV